MHGASDASVPEVRDLIVLQRDYGNNPSRFADRWRALLSHPARETMVRTFEDAALRKA